MGCLAVGGNAKFVGNGTEDFLARQGRIGEVERFDVARQALEQHPAQHGLAAADFAGDLDDAFILRDGIDQGVQRRAAIGTGEEKVGMRRDAEWRFAHAEVFEVQAHCRFQFSIRLYRVVRLMPRRRAASLMLPPLSSMAASM
ncbi:hypothetical protein SDC9_212394 [bioreactor metagenome]|uniref:Uncharacterized protein n=1 Tax=bioreactor metagenome TaxID=1076179 RepID=A0A645JLT1_9ZZZZ